MRAGMLEIGGPMTTADVFGKHLEAYKEHQNTPWSRLRYGIARANLMRHLSGKGLAILDAGGGNGLEAVALAGLGHKVALLDYSAEMLAEARRNAQDARVEGMMEFRQGDVLSIPQLFPAAAFDAVLCHNVLQYVDGLDAVLRALSQAVKPQGLLSIICVNRYSEVYRQALQELDLPAARAALDARKITSTVFDEPMRAYAAEDLREGLEKAGCSIAGEYGIRCVNDYIHGNEIKSDPQFFAELEKLEYALSGMFPYYLLARFIHIIAHKRAAQPVSG
jgi:S-adenosylmethionine-dependent methyltransferase